MTNISPFPSGSTTASTESITIESVMSDLKHWRDNKKSRGDKIPDDIWNKVFVLADRHDFHAIKDLIGISKAQYDNKRASLKSQRTKSNTGHIEFCEVKPSRSDNNPASTTSQSHHDFKITHTIIVELYRKDGEMMKIHTHTDGFKELLAAFYQGLK